MVVRRAARATVAVAVAIAVVVGWATPAPAAVVGGTWTSPGVAIELPAAETSCVAPVDDLALDPVSGSPGVFRLSGSFDVPGQIGSPPSGSYRFHVGLLSDLTFTPLTLTPPTYAVTTSPGAWFALAVHAVDEETCGETFVCGVNATLVSTAGSYAGGVLELTLVTSAGMWPLVPTSLCPEPYRSLWSSQPTTFTGLQMQV